MDWKYVDIDTVKSLMCKQDIDIRELSLITGVDVITLSTILSGGNQSQFSLGVYMNLADALSVPAAVLIRKNPNKN